MQESPTNIYIPPNISDDGGWFGGRLQTRNIIEAVIIVAVVFLIGKFLCLFLPFSPVFIVGISVGAVLGVIALAGIGGEPLSLFVLNIVNYRRTSGYVPMRMPMPDYAEEKEKEKKMHVSRAEKILSRLMYGKEEDNEREETE